MKSISVENSSKPLFVDEEDFDRLKGYKWLPHKNSIICSKAPQAAIHRLITGARKGEIVDHINGDIFDNRRCNLRFVTSQQNSWNQGIRSNNTSGFKGVSWMKKLRKYRASIGHNGKRKHLGVFDTPEEASQAYIEAANKRFGEYSYHNSREGQVTQNTVRERHLKIGIGDHIKFKLEKQAYTVQASNDRFIICTKPYNIRKTGMYTIIDSKKQIRGRDASTTYKRYETRGRCKTSLERLSRAPDEILYQNQIPLAIESIVRHSRYNKMGSCTMCNVEIKGGK